MGRTRSLVNHRPVGGIKYVKCVCGGGGLLFWEFRSSQPLEDQDSRAEIDPGDMTRRQDQEGIEMYHFITKILTKMQILSQKRKV